MNCLICEGTKGTSLIRGVPICSSCRQKLFRKCDCCQDEKAVNAFYTKNTRILGYILKEYNYNCICSDCVVTLGKEVNQKGIKECTQCGNLHSYTSSKMEGVCKTCESNLVTCKVCSAYHHSSKMYNLEGGNHVCRDCYYGNEGSYLSCVRCGRFHIIDDSKLYNTTKHLCTECRDGGTELCGICGSYTTSHEIVDGVPVCSSCRSYTCKDCKCTPIRPRRLDDDGDIYCSSCAGKRGSAIKQDWNYVPSTLFFHNRINDKELLYLGFENEQIIPSASSSISRMDLAKVLSRFSEKDIYAVFDGSIGGDRESHGANGYEIVSHPRTLNSHKDMNWSELFTENHEIHPTCGMHVHMSRSGFKREHLLRLMQLIYNNSTFTDIIAQRDPNEYTQSISTKMLKIDAKKGYKPKSNVNRRVKVNLCNKHTIELRFFSNVIDEEALMKNLEFTHAVYYYTQGSKEVSVGGFLDYVQSNDAIYENLINFIRMNKKEITLCV